MRYSRPYLNRFISADTIIPNPANPQSYNRYSYVLNRPLNFTDPTGHRTCSATEASQDYETCDQNLGTGAEYGNVDLFNNAFPFFFVKYLQLADVIDESQLQEGESLFDAIMHFATEDTEKYIANGFGDNALAGGMAAVFGGEYRSALPSDYLGQDVTFLIAAGYFADAGRMEGLRALLSESTPTGMPCSFSAETMVLTEDGLVPIAEVGQHEYAWAYNEESGEFGFYPIVAVWSHEDPMILYLTIDGETIATTPNHPFYTVDDEWVHA
ncbi:MAG: polymorphic toxin-type HINT domain-containing protein, partial [Chloroflexota bacterium]